MKFIRIKEQIKRTNKGTRLVTGLLVVLVSAYTLSVLINTSWAKPDYETIAGFEGGETVYTETVENNTPQSELDLPKTLRAVVELEISQEPEETVAETDNGTSENNSENELEEEPESQSLFTQTAPAADSDGEYDYYNYGYVAPRNEEELRESGELVIYTIYHADGSESYRVHGTWDGENEGFYACDETGVIFGVVKDIPVEWESKEYKQKTAGTYMFTAQIEGYSYEDEMPAAEIIVKAKGESIDENPNTCADQAGQKDADLDMLTVECSCDQAEIGHIKGCLLWNPECKCPEETTGHISEDCPYYVPLSDCECGIDADARPWEHQEGCKYSGPTECTCKGDKHDPNNTACLKYVSFAPASTNGGGANDINSDTLMRNAMPLGADAWANYIYTMWMNKAYNKFAWTPAANTGAPNGWAWGGGIANKVANGTTITTDKDPLCIPSPVSNYWTVYSGEQLLYALRYSTNGNWINLGANINLNGSVRNWSDLTGTGTGPGFDLGSKSLNWAGNDFTIYNLGVTSSGTTGCGSFIYNYGTMTARNLTFATAKIVVTGGQVGTGIFGYSHTSDYIRNFSRIDIKDSLIFGTDTVGVYGNIGNYHWSLLQEGAVRLDITTNMTNCIASGNYVYGTVHVSGMIVSGGKYKATNCASIENIVCAVGGDLAGFNPCLGGLATDVYESCFVVNELYGQVNVAGFTLFRPGQFYNCYVSGKIEGLGGISGFTLPIVETDQTMNNCYSTALVGLRSGPVNQSGFAIIFSGAKNVKMNNCYAAGEIGNYDVDMDSLTKNVGGFLNRTAVPYIDTIKMSNCYYDKQTTAMREWAAGDTKTVNGVRGVLTSDTDKQGKGLAGVKTGETPPALASTDSGFKGFSDNTKWFYETDHYPQLATFANASSTEWGTVARATLVKAYSKTSAATVILDTWDKGYDWDSTGVRTKNEQSYKRDTGTVAHKGNQYSYDTVREIVRDFRVTKASTEWTQQIAGGAPAQITDGGTKLTVKNSIEITGGTGKTISPGMDWYTISEFVSGVRGYRPLRLISYMNVDAGADKSVAAGTKYNHRSGVKFTMMDKITDNLVVGFDPNTLPSGWSTDADKTPHNDRIWATAVRQSYPNTTKFYEAKTNETNFAASKDAWVYTEIWRAKKDSSGNYVLDAKGNYEPDYSVKVTGSGTGSNATIDEQKWNGNMPLYTDTSVGQKYIITYYWMLSDGRYREDNKVITITPGTYELQVNVYNRADSSSNSTALYPSAAKDAGVNTNYSFGATTSVQAEALNNPYTTNVTAAWKKKSDSTKITAMKVTMTDADGAIKGSSMVEGDLKEGSSITIPINYQYFTTVSDVIQGYREVTATETVNITYTVNKDANGNYYLRFNKLKNAPSTEVASALVGGDSTGIPSSAKAYINDLSHHVRVDLYVEEDDSVEFTVNKKLPSPAEEEEQFVFRVDYHGNATSAGAVERSMYAVITIPAGETEGQAKFVKMPKGWYATTEMRSNWRFELQPVELHEDHPEAEYVSTSTQMVAMEIKNNGKSFTFRNKRLDIPWANGKDSITNDMPPVNQYK